MASIILMIACAPPQTDTADAGFDGPFPVSLDPPINTLDVPLDKVLRITFSDHLSAASFSSQKFSLNSNVITKWIMAYYNPVTHQAVIWPAGKMWPYSEWHLDINDGLLGLDGKRVKPGTVTSFRTGEQAEDNQPYQHVNFNAQIKPLFESRCASCHFGPSDNAIAGLSLDSTKNIRTNLISTRSKGWPKWDLISPAHPGKSYLLYKIIGDKRISGLPMPRILSDNKKAKPLSTEEQELFANWIASGAAFFDSDPDQQ